MRAFCQVRRLFATGPNAALSLLDMTDDRLKLEFFLVDSVLRECTTALTYQATLPH